MNKDLIPTEQEVVNLGHCLRPVWTSQVIGLAKEKHQSINVVGPRGSGKLRLLIDIQGSIIPGVKTVAVNLKSFTSDYMGLLNDIHGQLQLAGDVPPRLLQLFNRADHGETHYLILLGYYDVLLGNKTLDPKYDKLFFDDLNTIIEKPNFSLICTSVHRYNTVPILIGGKSYGISKLKLEVLSTPRLTRHQILDEFERRLDEYDQLWLKSNFEEKELLLENILGLPLPYSLLVFLASRIANQTQAERGIAFKKRLKHWIKIFAKQNNTNVHIYRHHMKLSPTGIWTDILTYLKKI